jgi:hypothetical protein
MNLILNDYISQGCLFAFNDIKTPILTVLEDQLTLHPNYKIYVLGLVIILDGTGRE